MRRRHVISETRFYCKSVTMVTLSTNLQPHENSFDDIKHLRDLNSTNNEIFWMLPVYCVSVYRNSF